MRLDVWALALWACTLPATGWAQDRQVTVRVEDPSGATIPAAHLIVLAGSDLVAEVDADAAGLARVSIGRSTAIHLVVSAPGFQVTEVDVAVPPRAVQHVITVALPLARVETDVVVTGVIEEAGGVTTTLSQAELAELPDDPEEMQRLLEEIAGPGAAIQVDGFRGGRMPPRDQIARVVIRRDAYSSEFHQVGQGRIEISTRPGLDRWRGNAGLSLRPSAWSSPNAFARQTDAGSLTRLSGFVAGPLVKGRVSLVAEVEGMGSDETRGISVSMPEGPRVETLVVPFDERDITVRTEGLLTARTLFRASYRHSVAERDNQGISELDLPERGYARTNVEQAARVSIEGGAKRPFHVRLQWEESSVESVPATRARAVVVQNSFRSGGATIDGRDRERAIDLDSMWTLVARPIAVRAGAQATSLRYSQGQLRNTLGTYTFTDLETFGAGTPATYTERRNARVLAFPVTQAAGFVQAELTRGGWSVGTGLRYEWQSIVDDHLGLAPRVGLTRSFRRNRTNVRAGYGWFYGWMPVRIEEETRRLSLGSLEEEIVIRDPGYPDPFIQGTIDARRDPPTRVHLAPGASLPRWQRLSLGIDHRLNDVFRVQGDVYHQRTDAEFRAVDLNAPVDGLRPDAASGRVVWVDSVGRARQTGFNLDLQASRRRMFANLRYSWGRVLNDGDDALTPPADGRTIAAEWGRARSDQGHRLAWSLGGPIGSWGLTASMFGRLQSGVPYTITTGLDDNGDALFIDRPIGGGRNTVRGAMTVSNDLRLTWAIPAARPQEQRGPGGGPRGGPGGGANRDRRFETYLAVNNLFNRVNYTSFVGVLTSPLFGQPTSALSARRVEVGWRAIF